MYGGTVNILDVTMITNRASMVSRSVMRALLEAMKRCVSGQIPVVTAAKGATGRFGLIWATMTLVPLASAVVPAEALTYTGRVVKIADGDMITMLVPGNRQVRVRLSEC